MKKMLVLVVMLLSLCASAVAQAAPDEVVQVGNVPYRVEQRVQIGQLLQQSMEKFYIESYDIEIGEEEKGGEKVYAEFKKLDNVLGATQIVSPNKKLDVSIASPLAKKMRISTLVVDKPFAIKIHDAMQSANRMTVAKQKGQLFRWGCENFEASEETYEALSQLGIEQPVKMTIIAIKQKDKESYLVKGVKGLVAVTGLWKTAKDWNNDYADLTPLLTSALMIQSIAGGNGGAISPMIGTSQMYAVEASQLYGGF